MNVIDLTRTITHNMSRWPSDPPVKLERVVKYGFVVDNILQTCMHIGTHIDAAQHMVEGGKSVAEYPPEKFMGRGVLLDARGQETIDVGLLEGVDIRQGDIVLIATGWDEKFGTPEYFEKYPVFTEAFAKKLVELKISIVGIDSPSPDNHPFPVHKILLTQDILIIEMLTHLDKLLGVPSFNVIALPPKFDAAGSFIRVVATILEPEEESL